MQTPRLVTIPYSHYCEKARWALERGQVAFVEETHAPLFAWRGALGAGGKRTVPVLVTDADIVAESTGVLRWVDMHGRLPEPPFPRQPPQVHSLVPMFNPPPRPPPTPIPPFTLLP